MSDKHRVEFEHLDSEIAKGVMKIILDDPQEKSQPFGGFTEQKNRRPRLTGRQIVN